MAMSPEAVQAVQAMIGARDTKIRKYVTDLIGGDGSEVVRKITKHREELSRIGTP